MVIGAEQGEVEQTGGSAVDPMSDVVRVAPLRRPPAAWEGAALVSGPQRGQQGWGHESLGSAHIEGLALAAQDHGDDGRIAGELADGLGGR